MRRRVAFSALRWPVSGGGGLWRLRGTVALGRVCVDRAAERRAGWFWFRARAAAWTVGEGVVAPPRSPSVLHVVSPGEAAVDSTGPGSGFIGPEDRSEPGVLGCTSNKVTGNNG